MEDKPSFASALVKSVYSKKKKKKPKKKASTKDAVLTGFKAMGESLQK